MMSGLSRYVLRDTNIAAKQRSVGLDSDEQSRKLIAVEFPRKVLRALVAQVPVELQSRLDGVQVGEVVRRQHLALDVGC